LGLLPNRRVRANSFDRADPGVAGTDLNSRKVIEKLKEGRLSPLCFAALTIYSCSGVALGSLVSPVARWRGLLLRSFDGLPVLSEVPSSLFEVVIPSVSRPREAGVALDFCWPLVDSSRDGLRVPFGEAVGVALADAVAGADAVAVGEAAALGEAVP
jgi:hypothetical protein